MKRTAPNAKREPGMTITPEVCPSLVVTVSCTTLQWFAPVCSKVEKDRLSIRSYLQLSAPGRTKIKKFTAPRRASRQTSSRRFPAKMTNYDQFGLKVYF